MASIPAQRARVAAHPVHGILSAYPLALFTAALVTDITYARTQWWMWSYFSIWLIAGGLLGGGLAALVGIVDAVRQRKRRGGRSRAARPWWHGVVTIVMLALALVNAFVHSRDGWTAVVPTGLVLSIVVSVLALVTSWTGFTLQAREEVR